MVLYFVDAVQFALVLEQPRLICSHAVQIVYIHKSSQLNALLHFVSAFR